MRVNHRLCRSTAAVLAMMLLFSAMSAFVSAGPVFAAGEATAPDAQSAPEAQEAPPAQEPAESPEGDEATSESAITLMAEEAVTTAMDFDLKFDGSLENEAGDPESVYINGYDAIETYETGINGQAIRLDGYNYIELEGPESAPLDYSGSFSLAFWMNLQSARGGDPAIFSNKDWASGGNPGFMLHVSTRWNEIKLNLAEGGDRLDEVVARTMPGVTGWQHVALVFDAENDKIYSYDNGVKRLDVSMDLSGGVAGNLMHTLIGQSYDKSADGTFYNGEDKNYDVDMLLDDFVMRDEIFSQTYVKQMFEAGKVALVSSGAWSDNAGDADLLDADFADGAIADHSAYDRDFSRGAEADNIAIDEALGKHVANFDGDAAKSWLTPWSAQDYAATYDAKYDDQGADTGGNGTTFAVTFKAERFEGDKVSVFGNMTDQAGIGIDLEKGSGDATADLKLYMKTIDTTEPYIELQDAIEYGKWYQATATYEGYEMALYLNGELRKTVRQWNNLPIPPEAARFFVVGGDVSDTGGAENAFKGAIASMRVYGHKLSAYEAEKLAERDLAPGEAEEDETVTFGVVSDTHVTATNYTTQARTEEAFKFYSDLGVDAVVVAGDLTDNGSTSEMDAWKASMQAGKSDDVRLIASMGNHEANKWANFEGATGNKANDVKVVNGYYFITVSPGAGTLAPATGRASGINQSTYSYAVEWLDEQLDIAEAASPDKPIFVFFHHPIRYTFYVSHEWYGHGLETVFDDHPRAVTFSGHIHSPNNHPKSIWQKEDGYTAINTVTLKYFEVESGMIYGSRPPNNGNAAQGLLVTADGSEVTVQNYDFISDSWIEQTWNFDAAPGAERPYTAATRSAQGVAPVFDEDAEIKVTQVGETVARVDFTQAHIPANGHPDDVVHSYKYDFVNKSTGLTDLTFKTFSEYYFLPMSETTGYNVSGLQPGTEYEVRIYAYDALGAPQGYQGGWEAGGKESEPLTGTFTTQGASPDPSNNFDVYRQGVAPADLLDVDFADGVISDHSALKHAFTGGANNIAFDEDLGKYVANFTGNTAQAWKTAWSSEDYKKTLDGLTLEAAFKADPLTGWVDVAGNMQSAGYGFEIGPEAGGTFYLEFWCHVDGYKVPKVTGLEYGEWYHAAGVYDGEIVKLYVNGKIVGQAPAAGDISKPGAQSRNFVVGGDSNGSQGIEAAMKGSISATRIYSEPLSATQVEVLANRELPSIDESKPIIRIEDDLPAYIVISEGAVLPAIKAADNSSVVKLTMKVDGVIESALPQGEIQPQSQTVNLIPETEIQNAEALELAFGAAELEEAAAMGVTQIVLTLRATDPAGNAEEVTHTAALFSEAPPPDTTKPVISFDSPLPAYLLYGEAATLPKITASDDSGAATLTVGIDGITVYDYTLENLLPEVVHADGVSPAMAVDADTVKLAYDSDVRTVVL
ncbi:MAG: metallophosphoesterase, partial [Clostridiales Family XIII bacterium]|nr:metallophosphoesterase [Clostridiales Family XIII bacterium]